MRIGVTGKRQQRGDQDYLTAYNGETCYGGFDLSFYRTRFLNHGMD